MSDFLQRLAHRATEPAVVQPRPLGRFEAPWATASGLPPATAETADGLPGGPLLVTPPAADPRATPVAPVAPVAQTTPVTPLVPAGQPPAVVKVTPIALPAAANPPASSAWTLLAPLPRQPLSPGRPLMPPARSLLVPPPRRLLSPERWSPAASPFAPPAPGSAGSEAIPAAVPAGRDAGAPPTARHAPLATLRAIHQLLPPPAAPLPNPFPPRGEGAAPAARPAPSVTPAPLPPRPPAPQPDSFPALLARLRATLAIEPEQPLARHAAVPPPAPVVHVHIGRVEVRTAPPPPPARRPRSAPALQTVDDYLRRRNGGST